MRARQQYRDGVPLKEIAEGLGCAVQPAHDIIRGIVYADVPGAVRTAELRRPR